MPRPRFQNLPEEKRLSLLEAAAKEFAAFGYEQASINRILETVGMSKGVAYYYFDDKADIFITTIRYYADKAFVDFVETLLSMDAGQFWEALKAHYTHNIQKMSMDETWQYGVFRALFSLSGETRSKPEIQAALTQMRDWGMRVLGYGQKIGAIRTDLPHDFLIRLLIGVDGAAIGWFAEQGETLNASERETMIRTLTNTLQTVLASPQEKS